MSGITARGLDRITGFSAIGFAVSVAMQNGVLLVGQPTADAAIADIAAFYRDNETGVGLAAGLVALNLALIFVFAAGLVERLRAVALWPRLGLMGVVLLAAIFAAITGTQLALLANAETLEQQPALTQLLWDLHSAFFALNMAALAIALGGFARAGYLGGLTPRWLALLGYLGAAGLLASAASGALVVEGSPIVAAGLLGFLTWLVFLLFTGVRLLRNAGSVPMAPPAEAAPLDA